MARHPAKRVKVTTGCDDVKDELVGDLAGQQEFLKAIDVFFV